MSERCDWCGGDEHVFYCGAAAMAGVIALATWVEREATRQWTLENLCGAGIHSYGHGDTCVECGKPDE